MKVKLYIALAGIALVVLFLVWFRLGPDSWEVQLTGVTGDGNNVQYRIESVYAGSSDELVFRNDDAGLFPPYFKFDSADLQARANRIIRNCPDTIVTVHGYSARITWLSWFPNATSIDAPEECLRAPQD